MKKDVVFAKVTGDKDFKVSGLYLRVLSCFFIALSFPKPPIYSGTKYSQNIKLTWKHLAGLVVMDQYEQYLKKTKTIYLFLPLFIAAATDQPEHMLINHTYSSLTTIIDLNFHL